MTGQDYSSYMIAVREHCGSAFLQLRFDHLRYLKGDATAAIILAYILNVLCMKDSNDKDREQLKNNDMWFRCPAAGIQKECGFGKDRQIRGIAKLVNEKIIQTSRRNGNTLWIRVVTKELDRMRMPQKSGNPKSGKPDNRSRETRNPIYLIILIRIFLTIVAYATESVILLFFGGEIPSMDNPRIMRTRSRWRWQKYSIREWLKQTSFFAALTLIHGQKR